MKSPDGTLYIVVFGIKVAIVADNFKINQELSSKQLIRITNYLIAEGFMDGMPDWCVYAYTE